MSEEGLFGYGCLEELSGQDLGLVRRLHSSEGIAQVGGLDEGVGGLVLEQVFRHVQIILLGILLLYVIELYAVFGFA